MSEKMSFDDWLTLVLPSTPLPGIAAFNFNLAESHDWLVDVIGASTYDEEDDDWACPPMAWSSGKPDFSISRHVAPTWEQALDFISERVALYLGGLESPHAAALRQAQAVCVGFVDGSLATVYRNGSNGR